MYHITTCHDIMAIGSLRIVGSLYILGDFGGSVPTLIQITVERVVCVFVLLDFANLI